MGTLYVVATPIGNLKDITIRAIETLKKVDFVVCEDTRVTVKLLNHYKIKKRLVSFHQHSGIQKIDLIVDKLKEGSDIALLTDSGTPGISDPGGVLTQKCLDEKIEVVPIPGASALLASISVSGLLSKNFEFLGFLPKKKGRQKVLSYLKKRIAKNGCPKKAFIFFESPHRLVKTLIDLSKIVSKNVRIVLCREMTKKFEEIKEGNMSEMIKHYSEKKPRGEFVIILKS
jgi:16S rRNA (cytidine1402-2'-O)-methyltransferase